jgi:hypothetical protein
MFGCLMFDEQKNRGQWNELIVGFLFDHVLLVTGNGSESSEYKSM